MGGGTRTRYNPLMEQTVTVAWTDGSRWTVSAAVFAQVTRLLDGLRSVAVGLDAVLNRWQSLAGSGATVDVDGFAPTEDDRAVFTAALGRALEEAHRGAAPADESPEDRATLLQRLAELHELFVTDITRR